MSIICSPLWKNLAAMLFLAIVVIGGVAIYIEHNVPIGTTGSGAHRESLHFFLAMVGIFVWARILQHIISFPEKYLPKRSLGLDADIYERRERVVQCIGYVLGTSTLIFSIYKILLLRSAL